MEIRKATKNDIPQILALLHEVLEIHAQIRPDIFVSGTAKYAAEDIEKSLEDEKTPIYVAVSGEEVLGYAMCEIHAPKFVMTMRPMKIFYIDDFCVAAKYRKQGVGQTLFEYLKKEAKRLGCYEIALYAWEGNEPAQRFYEKMGMKVKARTMEYIFDAVVSE